MGARTVVSLYHVAATSATWEELITYRLDTFPLGDRKSPTKGNVERRSETSAIREMGFRSPRKVG